MVRVSLERLLQCVIVNIERFSMMESIKHQPGNDRCKFTTYFRSRSATESQWFDDSWWAGVKWWERTWFAIVSVSLLLTIKVRRWLFSAKDRNPDLNEWCEWFLAKRLATTSISPKKHGFPGETDNHVITSRYFFSNRIFIVKSAASAILQFLYFDWSKRVIEQPRQHTFMAHRILKTSCLLSVSISKEIVDVMI